MTHADFINQVPRTQITSGLRLLADFLDGHPDVPVAPYGWDLLVSTHCATDPDGIARVDAIAAALGVTAEDEISDGGHYAAIKAFGPITYQAFHIPASYQAQHPASTPAAASEPPQAAR